MGDGLGVLFVMIVYLCILHLVGWVFLLLLWVVFTLVVGVIVLVLLVFALL